MPFENLSPDPAVAFFTDGMHDEILTALTNGTPDLEVISRTTMMTYRAASKSIAQIAKELNATYVLTGTLRRDEQNVRLSLELIDARSDGQMWAHIFNRKPINAMTLQSEVAGEVAKQLSVKLAGAARLAVPPTTDPQAYDLYLKAQAEFRKGGRAEMEESVRLLDQAIDRDPAYAQAYALRSGPKSLLYLRGYGGTLDSVREAEEDARRALDLAPELVEPRGALAMIQTSRGDWIGARENLDRVHGNVREVELFPFVGFVITAMGHLRWTDAVTREIARQKVTDSATAVQVATQSFVLGHTMEARQNMDLAIALGFIPEVPPLPMLRSMIAVRDKQYEQAATYMAQGLSKGLRALGAEPVVRQAIGAIGKPADRIAASAALRRLAERAGVAGMIQMEGMMMLIWQTQLGNLDAAFDWARRMTDAYKGGMVGRGILYWMWIEEMRPFREDPRFQAFTDELGLLEYWRQRGPPDLCTLAADKLTCH